MGEGFWLAQIAGDTTVALSSKDEEDKAEGIVFDLSAAARAKG